jgi:hypothetical protein
VIEGLEGGHSIEQFWHFGASAREIAAGVWSIGGAAEFVAEGGELEDGRRSLCFRIEGGCSRDRSSPSNPVASHASPTPSALDMMMARATPSAEKPLASGVPKQDYAGV